MSRHCDDCSLDGNCELQRNGTFACSEGEDKTKEQREKEYNVDAAHWIHSKESEEFEEHWTPSCCNHDIIENPRYINKETNENLDFKFCPYCGKKMKIKDGRVIVVETTNQ